MFVLWFWGFRQRTHRRQFCLQPPGDLLRLGVDVAIILVLLIVVAFPVLALRLVLWDFLWRSRCLRFRTRHGLMTASIETEKESSNGLIEGPARIST